MSQSSDVEDDSVGEAEPAVEALRNAADEAEVGLARAEGVHESAVDSLRDVEERDTPLAAAEAGAVRDLANAQAQITEIEARDDFAGLEDGLVKAREEAAGASVKLANAERDAAAHNVQEITKKIETIDAPATRVASVRGTQLLSGNCSPGNHGRKLREARDSLIGRRRPGGEQASSCLNPSHH